MLPQSVDPRFVNQYRRVPLTARRITGRPGNRPFFCSVIEASSDPVTVQKRAVNESLLHLPILDGY